MLQVRTGLAAVLVGGLLLVAAGCGGGNGSANNTRPTTTARTTCGKLAHVGRKLSVLLELLEPHVPYPLTAGHTRDIEMGSASLKNLARRMPRSLRPDVEVLADGYEKLEHGLKGMDLSSGMTATQFARLQTLSLQINQVAVKKASVHIAVSRKCAG